MCCNECMFECLNLVTLQQTPFRIYFSQWTGIDISRKLSSLDTNCMKCQPLFPGENKKTNSKCRLLKSLPRMLSIKKCLAISYREGERKEERDKQEKKRFGWGKHVPVQKASDSSVNTLRASWETTAHPENISYYIRGLQLNLALSWG